MKSISIFFLISTLAAILTSCGTPSNKSEVTSPSKRPTFINVNNVTLVTNPLGGQNSLTGVKITSADSPLIKKFPDLRITDTIKSFNDTSLSDRKKVNTFLSTNVEKINFITVGVERMKSCTYAFPLYPSSEKAEVKAKAYLNQVFVTQYDAWLYAKLANLFLKYQKESGKNVAYYYDQIPGIRENLSDHFPKQ